MPGRKATGRLGRYDDNPTKRWLNIEYYQFVRCHAGGRLYGAPPDTTCRRWLGQERVASRPG